MCLRIDVQLDHLIDDPGRIAAPQAAGVDRLHAGGRERGGGVREDHELLECDAPWSGRDTRDGNPTWLHG